jgi:hypothetical protein
MGKIFEKLKNMFKREKVDIPSAENGTLKTTAKGFTLENRSEESFNVDWEQVKQIVTFKKDCFAYDRICLEFKLNEQEYLRIHEHMIGFWEVTKSMQNAFPGISEDWDSKVMLPAFETNYSVLYPDVT